MNETKVTCACGQPIVVESDEDIKGQCFQCPSCDRQLTLVSSYFVVATSVNMNKVSPNRSLEYQQKYPISYAPLENNPPVNWSKAIFWLLMSIFVIIPVGVALLALFVSVAAGAAQSMGGSGDAAALVLLFGVLFMIGICVVLRNFHNEQ